MSQNSLKEQYFPGIIYLAEQFKVHINLEDGKTTKKEKKELLADQMEIAGHSIDVQSITRLFQFLSWEKKPDIGSKPLNEFVSFYTGNSVKTIDIFCQEYREDIELFLADKHYPLLTNNLLTPYFNHQAIKKELGELKPKDIEQAMIIRDKVLDWVIKTHPDALYIKSSIEKIKFRGSIFTPEQQQHLFFEEGVSLLIHYLELLQSKT